MREALVLVASTRGAAGTAVDRTGPVIATWLRQAGWESVTVQVVSDGSPVGDALRVAMVRDVDLVLTTGGTGLSPTDRTPEETSALLDRPAPGIAELLRAEGLKSTPFAALSRGTAGFANTTFVVNLPGSPNGVADSLRVLAPLFPHVFAQAAGRDHDQSKTEAQ